MGELPQFYFAGYLVQEPFWTKWPGREGMTVASIERSVHPEFKMTWDEVNGLQNVTRFHLALPDMHRFPGYRLGCYLVEAEGLETVQWTAQEGKPMRVLEYAPFIQRADDGLKRLGYEVVDCEIEAISILNNCGWSLKQIEPVAGRLNEHALFDTYEQARLFKEFLREEPDDPHSLGAVFEVWG
jgi:hypothetical protein